MQIVRRFLYPLRLARARLSNRLERVALVGIGIAAGAAMLAAVVGGSLVAQDRSLARATARIDEQDRAVRAQWAGVPVPGVEQFPALDRQARAALRTVSSRHPFAAMVFRESAIAGRLVDLSAVDGLGRWVRLRSGRLPRPCRPARCEVLELAGNGPLPSVPGLRLVRVGRGVLTSRVPLGTFLTTASSNSVLGQAVRYHRGANPPFLVAEGVAGLASSPALVDAYRAYAWVLPLAPGSVHSWSLDGFSAALDRGRAELAADSDLFDLTAPDVELQAAQQTAQTAGRRLLLIGGEAAALLLAFALLSAASLRRDLEAAWNRFTWYGARRWQLVLLAGAEAAAVALAGTAVGWGAGAAIAGVVAGRADVPVGAVLAHSVAAGSGFAIAAGVAGAAALVLLLALRTRPLRVGGLAVTAVDVAALGAAGAIAAAFARGSVEAQRGTGVVLLLLPALVAFVVAVLAARLLVPILRGLGRAGRGGGISLRLAALSLARRPGHAAAAVTFLVVSLGLALFAAVYRSTLSNAQHAEAAYAVPADFVLSEDLTKLIAVGSAAPLDRYQRLGRATPVIRLSGDVSRFTGSSGFTLLGLPAGSIARIDGWRGDFSRSSRPQLARRLGTARPLTLAGRSLRSRVLSGPISVRGADLAVTAAVQTPRGTFTTLRLGETAGRRHVLLRARVPPSARGGKLVALSFALTGTGLHGVPNGGANVNPVARGTMTLGISLPAWRGANGISPLGRHRFRYAVTSEAPALVRAPQQTDGQPLRVIVSKRLAAAAGPGGIVPLDIEGQRVLARVVGTVSRFPSVQGDVVVADAGSLFQTMNAASPGAAAVDEIWLDARDPARTAHALRKPPFTSLQVDSQRAVEHGLAGDPLARGALYVLAGAAVAALALALVGLLLGLVADLRDESGELLDLEAQGATPATLRNHVRLRTVVIAGFALIGGLGAGAALVSLVVRLVSLTAEATSPEPPLALSLDWNVVGLALAAYLLAAALLALLATRTAFRGDAPGRLTEAT
jgi:hypothetical protein